MLDIPEYLYMWLQSDEAYLFNLKVIVSLVRSLDSIWAPAARAMIIWMVGEYNNIGGVISKILPTLFSYLAGRFTLEAAETKLQILNACAKVVSNYSFYFLITLSAS